MHPVRTLTALAVLSFAGCAAPLVKPNPPAWQYRVDHPTDVSSLADRTATAFVQKLHLAGTSVFVAPGPADMPFASAFRKYLEIALLKQGCTVSESSDGSTVLNYDIQTFLIDRSGQKRLVNYASFWGLVGAITEALHGHLSVDQTVGATLIGDVAVDVIAELDRTTSAEVVVFENAQTRSKVLYADAESFYVPSSHLPTYMSQVPEAAPRFSPGDAPPLNTVPLHISGGKH